MLQVPEAFSKFKQRLELTVTEQQDASRRQRRIRQIVDARFQVDHDFLTGSYKRDTKTKPLKDVDIFTVLGDDEAHYLDEPPSNVLTEVETALVDEYGRNRVDVQRRSVRVDFGATLVDDLSGAVMSFDVTPAFPVGDHFVIPDRTTGDWMPTDPLVHAQAATYANQAFNGEWKPVVKMIKKWNEYHNRPIKPSFLVEVMALELLEDWGGSYPRELKAFFATTIDAIDQTWEDPAGLGHPVSDRMASDSVLRSNAKTAVRAAEAVCTEAINHEITGRGAAALDSWQNLFGPAFAKS